MTAPTNSEILKLAADFPTASAAQWRALVDKILKGADFEKRLVSRSADGLAIKPLYTRADAVSPALAGVATGGAGGWEIRQLTVELDAGAANAAIIEDLAGGVEAVTLQIAAPGSFGIDYSGSALARALEGVLLDVCPIYLRAGEYTADAAGSLLALWRQRGIAESAAQGGFNYDPLGSLAQTGALYNSVPKALGIGADLMKQTAAMPRVMAMHADGAVWHDAGATEAQELALVIATLVAYLRGAETAGVAPRDALAKIAVTLAVDADQFLGIAKLRAARRLIARVADVAVAAQPLQLAALTSARMMSRRDPWVNLLRTTTACAAAAMGGADAITVLPYSYAIGRPDAFARRIARNTQIVLAEESGLGRVADPTAGSWYVDSLSEELASAAWTIFQDLERQGGLAKAIETGGVRSMLAVSATHRRALIASGKLELTGTSAFPKLGDDGAKVVPWPAEVRLAANLNGARAEPLVMVRDAAPFEALRDAADRSETSPRVFLATLGPLAAHATRASWMRNFLAAGGIAAVGDEALLSSIDAGRAFAASGARVACLAASDAVYGELADATIGALKAAGAKKVYLAGRPKDEAALRAAGIDGFLFAGCDMIATLTRLHEDIGV